MPFAKTSLILLILFTVSSPFTEARQVRQNGLSEPYKDKASQEARRQMASTRVDTVQLNKKTANVKPTRSLRPRGRYEKGRMAISWQGSYMDYLPFWRNEFDYTIAPQMLTFHYQVDEVSGAWWRGNTEVTASLVFAPILRGIESRWLGFMIGTRYNFVRENWFVVPYLEGRFGVGAIDSRGEIRAQGQDLTVSWHVGAGVRYDFNENLAVTLGASYYHISGAWLTEPEHPNHGIDVGGPTLGLLWGF
ncbi:MAG: acyloxyacyl hydrolase [Methylacidiphilales bacterium]|nr:acyloxyacyl hydrolase [Candidatus Methylacidiphilales bacterium]MDW8349847.1 acyloxyacyl hydrolase [Verrucomicrobiae bacterium]